MGLIMVLKRQHENKKTTPKQRIPKSETAPPSKNYLANLIQRAGSELHSLTPDDMRYLQRTIGNVAVRQLITPQPQISQRESEIKNFAGSLETGSVKSQAPVPNVSKQLLISEEIHRDVIQRDWTDEHGEKHRGNPPPKYVEHTRPDGSKYWKIPVPSPTLERKRGRSAIESSEEKDDGALIGMELENPHSPEYVQDWLSSEEAEESEGNEDEDLERFKELLANRFKERMDSGLEDKEKREQELEGSSKPQRNLARLAWVIEKLKEARTCIAVLISNDKIVVFANHHDKKLMEDLTSLKSVATDLDEDKKSLEDLMTRIFDSTVKQRKMPARKETIEKRMELVRRRIRKVIEFLREFDKSHENKLEFIEHKPDEEHVGEKKHGELRVGDVIVKAKGLEDVTVDVGISRLCCAKCAKALEVLEEVYHIHFNVLGEHHHIYYTEKGWPIPNFLKNKVAMKSFLGEEAYKIYKRYPKACDEIIEGKHQHKLESREKKSKKNRLPAPIKDQSKAKTDIVSSEEEANESSGFGKTFDIAKDSWLKK